MNGIAVREKTTRRHFIAALALAGAGAGTLALAAEPPPSSAPTLLVLGDSISAEYGLARGQGWVALLQERLAAQKIPLQVHNASVSGETTAGGRTRLPALLAQHRPAIVIVELGANDALRGLPLAHTEDNLRAMAAAVRQAGARLLLLGMQVPPNYGKDYSQRFAALFAQVAQAQQAALVPFLLAGVADASEPLALFQADGIHPNAQAQPQLLANVWPQLLPLLKKPGPAPAPGRRANPAAPPGR